MTSGFANVIKPAGMTSSDVVVRLRRAYPKKTRVGHMGTLDPSAMGVLPIGIGKAARLFDDVIDKEKEYIAEMVLGVETTTQDGEGEVVARNIVSVDASALLAVMKKYTGSIMQVPPAYSAVKKDGKRLYDLARSGQDTTVSARPAQIYGMSLLQFGQDRALVKILCGKGTYIRTLLHDIGQELGCGAHMAYLVRSRSGPFTMGNGALLEDYATGKASLSPMDLPLLHLPALLLGKEDEHAVRNGNPLDAARFPNLNNDARCRVYLCGNFAGIAYRDDTAICFKAMLLEDGE